MADFQPPIPAGMTAGRPAPQPQRITELGGFEVLSKLGQGGMGAVYKARQKSLDRIVALKVLPPRLAQDSQFIERFLREARASARLNHLNIVQGIDVGHDKGLYYFAMEYVEGRSLQRVLEARGSLEEREAAQIVRQIAAALGCAHQAGLVHRDIKPDNILLCPDGTAKLADLGLAKQVGEDSSLTRTGMSVGTPHYISPEQARGEKDVDIRSDLYSLGATWFHLVTGRVLFDGDTSAVVLVKHLNEAAPKAHRVDPRVSEATGRLIDRLLRKNREQRIQTPSQLEEQIEALLAGETVASLGSRGHAGERERRGAEPAAPRADAPKRGSFVGLLALVVGAAAAGVLVLALRGGDPDGDPKRLPSTGSGNAAKGEKRPVLTVRDGPSGPGEPGKELPKAADGLAARLEQAKDWEGKNPTAYAELVERYQKVLQAAEGPPVEPGVRDEAERALRKVRERWSTAAEACWVEGWGKAERAARSGDYDAALGELERLPLGFAAQLNERALEKGAGLRREAEGRLQAAWTEAERRLAELEPEKGLEALGAVEHVRFAPWAERVRELKAKLAALAADASTLKADRARREAEQKIGEYLTRFDEAVLSRKDWTEGKRIATQAAADPALAAARETTAGLVEVAGAVEAVREQERSAWKRLENQELEWDGPGGKIKGRVVKVTAESLELKVKDGLSMSIKVADLSEAQWNRWRGEIKLETAAQKAAAALDLMGRIAGGKEPVKTEADQAALAEAARWLENAGQFPPVAHWMQEVRRRQVGAVEWAAQEYWGARVRPFLQARRLAQAEAEQALGILREFLAQFGEGRTRFAGSVEPEIAALRERIERATCRAGLTLFVNAEKKVYEPGVGAWGKVDVAGDPEIPEGATGLVLEIVNTDAGDEHRGQVRPAGSRDDLTQHTYLINQGTITAFVKLDAARAFEAWRDHPAVKFRVRGYTGREVVYFNEAVDLGAPEGGYGSFTAAADKECAKHGVPGNSLVMLRLEGNHNFVTRLRDGTGQASWAVSVPHKVGQGHQYVMAGVDAQGVLQVKALGGKVWLVGYLKGLGVWRPVEENVLGKDGEWASVSVADKTAPDAGVVLLADSNGWAAGDTRKLAVRAKGSADDPYAFGHTLYSGGGDRSSSALFHLAALDSSKSFEYKAVGCAPPGSRPGQGAGLRLCVLGFLVHPAEGGAPAVIGKTRTADRGTPPAATGKAALQRLFKGLVEDWDEKTGALTLYYDFKGGPFSQSPLREDWAEPVQVNLKVSVRGHKALFSGDIEFSFGEFLAAESFSDSKHGGLAWSKTDSNWGGAKMGLLFSEKENRTFAQIAYLGCVNHKEEVPLRVGERPCSHSLKMTAGRELAYSADGVERARYRFLQPVQPLALRPFLPPREHLQFARIAGSLQKDWLEEHLKGAGPGEPEVVAGAGGPGWPASKEEVQRLFRGQIQEYDPKSGEIAVVYKFDDPNEINDFERPKPQLAVPEKGAVSFQWPTSTSLIMNRFSVVNLKVRIQCVDSGRGFGKRPIAVWFGAEKRAAVRLNEDGWALCDWGKQDFERVHAENKQPRPKASWWEIQKQGNVFVVLSDNRVVLQGNLAEPVAGDRIAFGGMQDTVFSLGGLSLRGTLSREWLKTAGAAAEKDRR